MRQPTPWPIGQPIAQVSHGRHLGLIGAKAQVQQEREAPQETNSPENAHRGQADLPVGDQDRAPCKAKNTEQVTRQAHGQERRVSEVPTHLTPMVLDPWHCARRLNLEADHGHEQPGREPYHAEARQLADARDCGLFHGRPQHEAPENFSQASFGRCLTTTLFSGQSLYSPRWIRSLRRPEPSADRESERPPLGP